MASETKFKKTEIGMIPEDWDVGELKDFCSKIGSGATPRGGSNVYVNSGIAFIRSQNVYDEGFKTEGLVFIQDSDAKKLNSVEVKKNDILFNITGDSICRCCIVPDSVLPARVNQHVSIIRTNNKLYYKFLYCYLCLNRTKETLLSFDAGGTRKAITKGNLEKLLLPLPSYIEQTRIGDFIGLINDKIDLNHQMNSTLEQIAQTLFKHWFIDFEFPDENGNPYKSSGGRMVDSELGEIPEGWKIKPIDEVADFLNGLALQKYPPEGDEYLPVIKIRELKQGITDVTDKASTKIEEKYVINDGDILFSWSGSLECCIWCNGVGALNQHLFKVTSSNYPKWFCYFWIDNYLPYYRHIAKGKATTMGHIQRCHLSETLVLVPTPEILSRMNERINPLFEKIINNNLQSRFCLNLRDSLLPKLMSGKIRVQI